MELEPQMELTSSFIPFSSGSEHYGSTSAKPLPCSPYWRVCPIALLSPLLDPSRGSSLPVPRGARPGRSWFSRRWDQDPVRIYPPQSHFFRRKGICVLYKLNAVISSLWLPLSSVGCNILHSGRGLRDKVPVIGFGGTKCGLMGAGMANGYYNKHPMVRLQKILILHPFEWIVRFNQICGLMNMLI